MNEQIDIWSGKFGDEYIKRNPKNVKEVDELYLKNFGFSRTSLNLEFLGKIPREIRVLEVGCGIGIQLSFLQKMGFKHLVGLDVSSTAIEQAKILTKGIDFLTASTLDIPFKDSWFDLVFTSALLIHQNPRNLPKAIDEIVRVSNSLIWGYEFFSLKPQKIFYREQKNLLWKNNFMSIYLKRCPELKVVNEKRFKYLDNDNVDCMFLLKKSLKKRQKG